ncbi:hypothetical protein DPMN_142712 [Dreissena polymorpha]|uniref:Potassium channel tetramerisation-type BTB domain-containing protein n=1 Tax=Dreissena polymorpha TaxID=45954 RepID=A0A9D4JMF8_DREPO|nr:hypothetical protein DPMN_142712 [Dreissena polymorpha]
MDLSYNKKTNIVRHIQTNHLHFKYQCQKCNNITNRREDHRCKNNGIKRDIILINTLHNLQGDKAEEALKKVKIDDYISTRVERRCKIIQTTHEEHKRKTEITNEEIIKSHKKERKKRSPKPPSKPTCHMQIKSQTLTSYNKTYTCQMKMMNLKKMWKLNAPENIELEFPVPEDISENNTLPQKQKHQQEEHKEGRLPERFIIPKKNKQSNNNVTSRTPLDIDKRIVTKFYEPKNNVLDKILNKMDNPRQLISYKDIQYTESTLSDNKATFEEEPENEEDPFKEENLKDKLTELKKQNNSKIKLNVGGYIFTTSKHTLSKEPYSLLHHLTKETTETEIFIDRPAKHF